ncbi:protein TolR [Sulfuriferula sp.]|uniref:protein TolR n=1 Tax=Sulfuriferula sp. TaxID=2025307 RepID=UPI0027311C79|nr:protein TolR [Sulfuriferula sp.]MDP2024920.1 protein TolR [Sulfuriferula sp.]
MAAKLSSGNTNGLGPAPISEINVTPLVDVMLVLLIVFMVSAPMMTVAVKVDLPTNNAKPLTEKKPPVTVSMNGEGKVFIGEKEVSVDALIPALRSATQGDMESRISVRADKTLSYGRVIETMGLISDAGFSKVALVSEQRQNR